MNVRASGLFAGRVPGLRAVGRVSLLVPLLLLAAACHSGSGATSQPTVTVTAPASSAPATFSPSIPPPTGEPGIVAVTTAGALVTLDPATGSVQRTLVPGGVLGGEIAVSPDGSTVYYAEQQAACDLNIFSIGINGGTPTPVASGEDPAISPDGTKLAFAQEPVMTQDCLPGPKKFASDFKLVILTLSSGAQRVIPQPPQVVKDGLPDPISYLSWASDSTTLAVSISSVQDNEGWGLYLLDTATASYYVPPGAGLTSVPVTGSPDPQRSYIREGIFLPDGNLFISRACCAGVPIHNTSRLMWEVDTSGALVHQVAIGYPDLDHMSLAADSSGQWLLYLGGNDLYVSSGGSRPTDVAQGLIAAAWI